MEIEHIVPESRGGPTTEENLWLACAICNRHKGRRTTVKDPASGQQVSLFNPRQQEWAEHFAWIEAGTQIAGLTAIGRGTVEALDLNRMILVRARFRWIEAGWHPPLD